MWICGCICTWMCMRIACVCMCMYVEYKHEHSVMRWTLCVVSVSVSLSHYYRCPNLSHMAWSSGERLSPLSTLRLWRVRSLYMDGIYFFVLDLHFLQHMKFIAGNLHAHHDLCKTKQQQQEENESHIIHEHTCMCGYIPSVSMHCIWSHP